jgi:hypothetical protein
MQVFGHPVGHGIAAAECYSCGAFSISLVKHPAIITTFKVGIFHNADLGSPDPPPPKCDLAAFMTWY